MNKENIFNMDADIDKDIERYERLMDEENKKAYGSNKRPMVTGGNDSPRLKKKSGTRQIFHFSVCVGLAVGQRTPEKIDEFHNSELKKFFKFCKSNCNKFIFQLEKGEKAQDNYYFQGALIMKRQHSVGQLAEAIRAFLATDVRHVTGCQ